MSITPLHFTGASSYSEDLQTILSRAVSIASIPLTTIQNDQADLLSKKQLLSDLGASVAGLGLAVAELGRLGRTRAVTALSSNANRVAVTLNGEVSPGAHTISNISSLARAASATSASGYASADAAAVSSDGTLELAVGSETYSLDLTASGANTLQGVRDAINALGAGVSASILNTGSGDTPFYLSVTAEATGEQTLELRETAGESGTNLLTAGNPGADAVFQFDGLEMVRSDNVVTDVLSGLTFTLQSATAEGEQVSVLLSSNRGELAGALQDLVSAYNEAGQKVNAQIGEAAGLLSGDPMVREIQTGLRALTTYSSGSGVKALADLGIVLDDKGVMSFDSSVFYALPNTVLASAFEFLGSETSGLGAVAGRFTALSDPVSGLFRMQQDQYDASDQRLGKQADALTERINLMQTALSLQLAQADTLLALLESQRTTIDASIQGLELALYGKRDR